MADADPLAARSASGTSVADAGSPQGPDRPVPAGATGSPGLLVATGDGTATITISNPARRNAMTLAMWRSLPPLLDALAGDPTVRVLVLT
ncbi:MAG: hypothetical protein FWE15_18425, partial [Actinomycetia bacterium]|nr:hypothetical protein [Actinomycetes bacterium]